ncbi:unnamed protein product [Phytophthora fragariaefolia]|uniref:Unnamed protein product n=1 Tax=Phytophthora fragariaefolia TaxID=1490495 RepID=A0A9W7D4I0_9STRA|nr:unnamed protein product [Phytophthora fragariaefolia]
MTCYEIWHQLWQADDDQDTTGGANSNAPDGATGGTVEENRDNGSNDGAANEEEGGAGYREEDRAGNKESDNTGHEEGDNTGHEEGENTRHEEGTDKENSSRSGGAAD